MGETTFTSLFLNKLALRNFAKRMDRGSDFERFKNKFAANWGSIS